MFHIMVLTFLALIAFAGNSVLCRLALDDGVIDAGSFTSIRLVSGAVMLGLLVVIKNRKIMDFREGSWTSSFLLFVYALSFSYAYLSLDTGTGALILFGAVQVTMIIAGLFKGKRLIHIEWLGLFVAFGGLVVLLIPGASSPSLTGFLLMALSGVAWGSYSLLGQGKAAALVSSSNNFLRTLPFVFVLTVFTLNYIQVSMLGIGLAVASGAITSGIGYAIWYSALKGLSITQAAVIQLLVPVFAGFGGIIFLDELISLRLFISTILVLGGVLLVILGKRYFLNR